MHLTYRALRSEDLPADARASSMFSLTVSTSTLWWGRTSQGLMRVCGTSSKIAISAKSSTFFILKNEDSEKSLIGDGKSPLWTSESWWPCKGPYKTLLDRFVWEKDKDESCLFSNFFAFSYHRWDDLICPAGEHKFNSRWPPPAKWQIAQPISSEQASPGHRQSRQYLGFPGLTRVSPADPWHC